MSLHPGKMVMGSIGIRGRNKKERVMEQMYENTVLYIFINGY